MASAFFLLRRGTTFWADAVHLVLALWHTAVPSAHCLALADPQPAMVLFRDEFVLGPEWTAPSDNSFSPRRDSSVRPPANNLRFHYGHQADGQDVLLRSCQGHPFLYICPSWNCISSPQDIIPSHMFVSPSRGWTIARFGQLGGLG